MSESVDAWLAPVRLEDEDEDENHESALEEKAQKDLERLPETTRRSHEVAADALRELWRRELNEGTIKSEDFKYLADYATRLLRPVSTTRLVGIC